jgi:pimeloyl-ACP methyl ester carboxylesterase
MGELIKWLGKDKVTLIGHSLGCELAVTMVSRYEYLFDKAVFPSSWLYADKKKLRKWHNPSRR